MAQPAPQTPAPQVPKSQPGKKKTRLIIVLAVAVVVVVAVAILIALVLVPSCSSDPKEQPAVEEPRENEPAVDREDAEGEPEDGNDSDNQGEEQEKPIDDERLGSFDGTLYESTTLPLSFMLPPDYTVDENRERILCASPTGLAQIQIYRIAGIKAADVAAEQENYNRDAINRFNGSLYEFTSAEDVVYYDTTWHRVIFKSNDADGNLINYWLTYTDDGSGGVVFCAYGLFFGPSGTASIDELSGLDIQESMKLDRAAI
jgi:hypothetical protein